MPKLRSFTLIELLLVIVLLGILYSLSLRLFSVDKQMDIANLYSSLYPNGKFTLYVNGSNNHKFNIKITNPTVYEYYNNKLVEKIFGDNISFEYQVKNGIGSTMILKCDEGVYLFKPFWVIKMGNVNDILSYQSELVQ